MRLQLVRAATIVVTAGAAIGFAACGGDDEGLTERTLRFTEKEQGRVTGSVDVPPRTFSRQEGSPGDTWVFTKALFDESAKPAGNVRANCAAFTAGNNPTATCDGVIQLEGGTLAFTEVFRIEDESRTAAITGGTAAFAGATGTFRGGGELGKRDEIHLFLP